MSLEEFIRKYNGKKVDFDGKYGAQCVDLFRQYAKECLNIAEPLEGCSVSGGARDLFENYPNMPKMKKHFNRFPLSDTLFSGDVVVWGGTKGNPYGHVAILVAPMKGSLIVFEQDGYRQDGAKLNIRSKENVLGILRTK